MSSGLETQRPEEDCVFSLLLEIRQIVAWHGPLSVDYTERLISVLLSRVIPVILFPFIFQPQIAQVLSEGGGLLWKCGTRLYKFRNLSIDSDFYLLCSYYPPYHPSTDITRTLSNSRIMQI